MSHVARDLELRGEFVKIGKRAAYGTAGFRDLAVNMPYVSVGRIRSPLELVLLLLC